MKGGHPGLLPLYPTVILAGTRPVRHRTIAL